MKGPETQERKPDVPENLQRVGITNLRTLVKTGFGGHEYKFVPRMEIMIDLPKDKKGVHMSRLVESIAEIVNEEAAYKHESFERMEIDILERLREKHPYHRGEISLATELVVERKTPVSKKDTMEAHDVFVKLVYEDGEYRRILRVLVVGNTVCPHSKENTKRPHIQRAIGELELETDYNNRITLGDMIECVEESFSSEVYTLVKTEDENYMVNKMYDNPVFVEDVTRNILANAKKRFKNCKIRAKTVSQESIHRHDVVAEGYTS
jgi:GTP cyclohydrolase-4